jgi:AcrR family transcriptional regulator
MRNERARDSSDTNGGPIEPATTINADPAPASDTTPTDRRTAPRKPRGREEVVESIIDATLSLWTAQGPEKLSMRRIAARAGVNYGLVHRHFGTKDAVIRAAMERVVNRALDNISGSTDLADTIDRILPISTGAHARLLAWATLQYVLDDVLPDEDVFLTKMRRLADVSLSVPDDDKAAGETSVEKDPDEAAIRTGSMIAMLYGWRLFEPYLVRGLGLGELDRATLDQHISQHMRSILDRSD